MERPKNSSRSKHRRETSKDLERHRHRRSPSRANPSKPRTTVISTSREIDDDYDYDFEYDDPLPRPSKSRGKQPHVEGRGARSTQPSSALQPSESSSTYQKPYQNRRSSIQYYSDRKGRGTEDTRKHVPRDAREDSDLAEAFEDFRLRNDDIDYELLSRRQSESSPYTARHPDAAQNGPFSIHDSLREHDPAPSGTVADGVHYGESHPPSDYQAYGHMSHTSPQPPNVETRNGPNASRHESTAQHLTPSSPSHLLPASSEYQSSQQNTASKDARKQNNAPPRGIPNAQQKLDASFFVRKKDYKDFFGVGKVFMTLWSEQYGSSNEQGSFVSDVIYGEKVYSKVRRFIVVRKAADKRSASCLPITSYGGNGFGKTGIDLGEHGFIYSKKEPDHVSGLCSKALRVYLSPKSPDLTHPSLVNYGKVYNVESNWKVKDIGDLDDDSRKALLRYFRKVFRLEDDADLPEAEMTPRAKNAVLAHVGAGVSVYPGAMGGTNQTAIAASQNFESIPATEGYPPRDFESRGYEPRSTMYQQSASTHGSMYPTQPATQYESRPYHSVNYGTPSSRGYAASYAPSNTTSAPSYYNACPSTSNYSDQYDPSNSSGNRGTAYQNNDNRDARPPWPSAAPTSSFEYADNYRYPVSQFAPQTTSDTVYTKSPERHESAVAQIGTEADILLPSGDEAAEILRERKRRDSKATDGSSSHRRRRDDRRH